ncbi:MAG: hypothetical protein ACP6IY_20535 [Promethearchaeia archaeon]
MNELLNLTVKDIGIMYCVIVLFLMLYVVIYLAVKSLNWIDYQDKIDRKIKEAIINDTEIEVILNDLDN